MKYDPVSRMRFSLLTGWLSLVFFATVSAAPEKEAARRVRFLAVGEMPPFRQEVRDDVRYELEPPAGSIPPREVLLAFGDEKTEAARLRLGLISSPLVAPGGAGPLLLKRSEAAADAEPWLRLTRPEVGDFLVLLWRDAAAGTWDKAQSMVLPDDAISAPAGGVRVINVSPVPVRVVIGEEKLLLDAGKSFHRTVPSGVEQPFQILLPDASGNLRSLHSGVITQNPGERSLVLVFRADGESPRRPLKVSLLREPAPAVPKSD